MESWRKIFTGGDYTVAVDQIGNIIRNSPTEMKARALHCFASLISIEKDANKPKSGPVDHRVTLMTREWFRSLNTSPNAMETLFTLCKNPFPDIRLAAFTLLDAVCQHQWGEELVARTAGIIISKSFIHNLDFLQVLITLSLSYLCRYCIDSM